MRWRHTVDFVARRVALLTQPGDEDLTYLNPLALLQDSRSASNVIEHVLNGFHFRNGMIEFNHAGVGGVDVRIDETRKNWLATKVHDTSRGCLERQDVAIAPHLHDPSISNRHSLSD